LGAGVRAEPGLLWSGDVGANLPILRCVQCNAQVETVDEVCRPSEAVHRVSDIFRMYAGMSYGSTVRDLCRRLRPQDLAINERKLHSASLVRTYNGMACLDELCCQAGLSAGQLEEQLERDTSVVFIVK
ncbi:Tumor suppressor candidate 4, partial [Operophtera brumata]